MTKESSQTPYERAKALRAEGRTFTEIGNLLGVTRQWAEQLAKLEEPPKKRGRPEGKKVFTEDSLRRCKKCGTEKPLTEFTTAPSLPGGRVYVCYDCQRVQHRERQWGKLSDEELLEMNRKDEEIIRLRNLFIEQRRRGE